MTVGAFVLVASLLAGFTPAGFQEPATAESIRTRVRISADDELRPKLDACLARDLKLGGRKVVGEDEPADETLTVIALRVVLRSRGEIGVAYSVTATRPASKVLDAFGPYVSADHRAEFGKAAAPLVQPVAHWLETGDRRNVEVVCKSIAKSHIEAAARADAAGR